jgi:hypothetical protein
MKPTNHSYAGVAMPVASCHSFLFRLLQPINLSSIKAALGLYKDCWVLFMMARLPVKSGTNILREKAPWTMDSIDLGENGLAERTIYLQLKGLEQIRQLSESFGQPVERLQGPLPSEETFALCEQASILCCFFISSVAICVTVA